MQKITELNFRNLNHQSLYWRKISKFKLTKCILLITEKIQTECKASKLRNFFRSMLDKEMEKS